VRGRSALSMSALVIVASAACSSSAEDEEPDSPCVAFAKAGEPALRVESVAATRRVSPIVRFASVAGRTYALDRDGRFGRLDAEPTATLAANAVDVVVERRGSAVRAFAARWTRGASPTSSFELVRFTSPDDGMSFDAASEKSLFQVAGLRDLPEATSLALGGDGLLYIALGDAYPNDGSPKAMLGKILRLDVGNDAAAPEIWSVGVHEPRGLDVDAATGDVWLTDRTKDDTAVVLRITRSSTEVIVPTLYVTTPQRRPAFAGGHVYRGKSAPSLVGHYVYPAADGKLVSVDRFGPSGPAQASLHPLGAQGPIGRDDTGELAVATDAGVGRVTDSAARPAPLSLLATKCWNPDAPSGLPAGAIAYDVTTPLWSDGAAKERFVVVPARAPIASRGDGDLVFPVGTVAVKTFAIDGKRIETRLLVQHDLDDWVGYSYAWNAAGTDAELVVGDRTVGLPGGKSWYFPSTTDCTACHTPAAGYTLGLEARQLTRGDALARLEAKLASPINRALLAPFVPVDAPPPATAEARARSYLHANCSTCHREGSATGTNAELDLRFDTPLAATGLCREPQVGALGIANPRIVTPRDPARSVLVARMRSLDERRMPKLASRVVDEAGVAAVEAWIRDLATCP
jgi:uncharacterized repeat protein (TIGR03806 family)